MGLYNVAGHDAPAVRTISFKPLAWFTVDDVDDLKLCIASKMIDSSEVRIYGAKMFLRTTGTQPRPSGKRIVVPREEPNP